MHETRFANEIVYFLKKNIDKNKELLKVTVNIRLSSFSHITNQCLKKTAKDLLQKENLRNITLKIFPIKHTLNCKNCKHTTSITKKIFNCPLCNSMDFDIKIDKEFFIESLEIEYK